MDTDKDERLYHARSLRSLETQRKTETCRLLLNAKNLSPKDLMFFVDSIKHGKKRSDLNPAEAERV
jgi:hypothetical protein